MISMISMISMIRMPCAYRVRSWCGGAAMLLSVLAPAPAALAGDGLDRFWNNPSGGAFGDEANWIDGGLLGVPGPGDTAVFDTGLDYTVTFLEGHVTDRVVVRTGHATFDLTGGGYDLLSTALTAPAIVIGDDTVANARLSIEGGTLRGAFASVGRSAVAFGTLEVRGAQTDLRCDTRLTVGEHGLGILDVTDGAYVLAGSAVVAHAGPGVVTTSGVGSRLEVIGTLTVGKGGYGSLALEDGATASTGALVIAQQLGSVGTLVVEDASLQVHGSMDVGMVGHGRLTVRNATVTTGGFVTLGSFASGSFPDYEYSLGEVVLEEGATWIVDGDLFVGLIGNGRLTLERGASAVIGGALELGLWSPRELEHEIRIEIGGADDYPSAAIQAGAIGDMEITVTLAAPFEPQLEDVFYILQSVSPIGEITFDLPTLPAGLRWHVFLSPTSATLLIVPRADFDGNGIVDIEDLLLLIGEWGTCEGCVSDINGDGFVNVDDLVALLAAFD